MAHKVDFNHETGQIENHYDDGRVEVVIIPPEIPIPTPEEEIAKLHAKIDHLTRKLAQKSVITAKEQDDILLPTDIAVTLDAGTVHTPVDTSTLKGKGK